MTIFIDEDVNNADWPKRTWDLPTDPDWYIATKGDGLADWLYEIDNLPVGDSMPIALRTALYGHVRDAEQAGVSPDTYAESKAALTFLDGWIEEKGIRRVKDPDYWGKPYNTVITPGMKPTGPKSPAGKAKAKAKLKPTKPVVKKAVTKKTPVVGSKTPDGGVNTKHGVVNIGDTISAISMYGQTRIGKVYAINQNTVAIETVDHGQVLVFIDSITGKKQTPVKKAAVPPDIPGAIPNGTWVGWMDATGHHIGVVQSAKSKAHYGGVFTYRITEQDGKTYTVHVSSVAKLAPSKIPTGKKPVPKKAVKKVAVKKPSLPHRTMTPAEIAQARKYLAAWDKTHEYQRQHFLEGQGEYSTNGYAIYVPPDGSDPYEVVFDRFWVSGVGHKYRVWPATSHRLFAKDAAVVSIESLVPTRSPFRKGAPVSVERSGNSGLISEDATFIGYTEGTYEGLVQDNITGITHHFTDLDALSGGIRPLDALTPVLPTYKGKLVEEADTSYGWASPGAAVMVTGADGTTWYGWYAGHGDKGKNIMVIPAYGDPTPVSVLADSDTPEVTYSEPNAVKKWALARYRENLDPKTTKKLADEEAQRKRAAEAKTRAIIKARKAALTKYKVGDKITFTVTTNTVHYGLKEKRKTTQVITGFTDDGMIQTAKGKVVPNAVLKHITEADIRAAEEKKAQATKLARTKRIAASKGYTIGDKVTYLGKKSPMHWSNQTTPRTVTVTGVDEDGYLLVTRAMKWQLSKIDPKQVTAHVPKAEVDAKKAAEEKKRAQEKARRDHPIVPGDRVSVSGATLKFIGKNYVSGTEAGHKSFDGWAVAQTPHGWIVRDDAGDLTEVHRASLIYSDKQIPLPDDVELGLVTRERTPNPKNQGVTPRIRPEYKIDGKKIPAVDEYRSGKVIEEGVGNAPAPDAPKPVTQKFLDPPTMPLKTNDPAGIEIDRARTAYPEPLLKSFVMFHIADQVIAELHESPDMQDWLADYKAHGAQSFSYADDDIGDDDDIAFGDADLRTAFEDEGQLDWYALSFPKWKAGVVSRLKSAGYSEDAIALIAALTPDDVENERGYVGSRVYYEVLPEVKDRIWGAFSQQDKEVATRNHLLHDTFFVKNQQKLDYSKYSLDDLLVIREVNKTIHRWASSSYDSNSSSIAVQLAAWSVVEDTSKRPPRQAGVVVKDEGDGGVKLAEYLATGKFI